MNSGREKKPRRGVAVDNDHQPVVVAGIRRNDRTRSRINLVRRANRKPVPHAHATASLALAIAGWSSARSSSKVG